MVLLAAVTLPPTFLTDLLLKKLSWSVESLFLGINQIVDLATRKAFAFSRFILLFQPDGGIIHWQNYSENKAKYKFNTVQLTLSLKLWDSEATLNVFIQQIMDLTVYNTEFCPSDNIPLKVNVPLSICLL